MTCYHAPGQAVGERVGGVETRELTAEDYRRAEQFLPWNAERLIGGLTVEPHWLDGGERFWYRRQTRGGHAFVLVDPQRRSREPAFDHARLATALSRASGTPTEAGDLPFDRFAYEGDSAIRFDAYGRSWRCDLGSDRCESVRANAGDGTESPDGCWRLVVRDHNLFLRSPSGAEEVALTFDGVAGNDYGTPLPSPLKAAGIDGRMQPPSLAALWSPESRRFLSYRIDSRAAGLFHLVQSTPLDGGLRPALHSYVYPLPGDTEVPIARLIVVDTETKEVRPVEGLEIPMLYYGSPLRSDWIWWSEDGARAYVVTRGRGYQSYALT